MSNYVDERIVEMKFDNKDFEKNVQITLKTLAQLQEKLKLEDAGKSFNEISKASSKIDLSNLSNNVQTVADRFSFLGIVGDEVIRRLTNGFMDLGAAVASTVKELTIDQVGVGFDKYERKVQSVQTIINATGRSIDDVNESLDKLNWFTDETSYSYADMVDNIGKFTSSNVDLETAVTSMIGIANAAGLAGASTQDASHAMEGFSKAIAQGYMSRQNWQWIRTAHMDTTKFKDVLIQAALAMGTLTEASDGTKRSMDGNIVSIEDFETALKDGWMTTEVINKALHEFGGTAEEIYKEYLRTGKLTSEIIADMGVNVDDLGLKAFRAAQEAKTFSDAINSVKDAVSTGWMTSFETIFGNYEEAKVLWTNVANDLWDIFASGGDRRNEILANVFSGPVDEFKDRLSELGVPLEKFEEALKNVASSSGIDISSITDQYDSFYDALKSGVITTDLAKAALRELANEVTTTTTETAVLDKDLDEVIQKVKAFIRGGYGSGDVARRYLEQQGYEYEYIKDLAEKVLRENRDLTLDDIRVFEQEIQTVSSLTDEQREAIAQLIDGSDEAEAAFEDLFKTVNRESGRELVSKAISNTLASIKQLQEALSGASINIFGDDEKRAETLYNIINALEKFTEKLILTDEASENLQKTFEGLFSIIKIIWITFERILTILSPLRSLFNLSGDSILEFTGNIGSSITAFADWYEHSEEVAASTENLRGKVEAIVNVIKGALRYLKRLKDAYLPVISEKIQSIKDNIDTSPIKKYLKDFKDGLRSVWNYITKIDFDALNIDVSDFSEFLDNATTSVTGFYNSAKDFLLPYVNKLREGFSGLSGFISPITTRLDKLKTSVRESGGVIKYLSEKIRDIKNDISDFIKNGGLSNLFNNFVEQFAPIRTAFETFINNIKTTIEGIEWGDVLSLAIGFSLVAAILSISKMFNELGSIIKSGRNILTSVGTIITRIKNGFKTTAMEIAEAAVAFSIAIGILTAALWVLATQIKSRDLDRAVKSLVWVIAAFAALITATAALSKWAPDMNKASFGLLAIAGAIGILAVSLYLLKDIEFNWAAILSLLTLLGLMVAAAIGLSKFGVKMEGVGLYFLTFAGAVLILSVAMKKLAEIDTDKLEGSLTSVFALMFGLGIIAALSGLIKGSAFGLVGLVVATFLIIKLVESLGDDRINAIIESAKKHLDDIMWLVVGLLGLAVIAKFGGENSAKVGIGIALMAASLLILLEALKRFGEVEDRILKKGLMAVGVILALYALISLMSTIGKGGGAAKAGVGIMAMAASLIIVYYALKKFGELDNDVLGKGLAAITGIFLVFSILLGLSALAGAFNGGKALLSMAVLLLAITASLAILSIYNWDQLKAGMAALCIVLVSVGAAIGLINAFSKDSKPFLNGLEAILLLGAVAAALYFLSDKDWDGMLHAVEAIALCLGAVVAALAILNQINFEWSTAFNLCLGIVLFAVIGLLLGYLSDHDWGNYLGIATAISEVLLAVAGALALTNGVKFNIEAIGMIGLALLAVGVVALILIGLAAIFADLIASGFEKASERLPTIAENIKALFSALQGIEPVDPNLVDQFDTIAKAFLALSAANFINTIIEFFKGADAFSSLEGQFETFGRALTQLVLYMPDKNNMERVKDAINSIKEISIVVQNLPSNTDWKKLTNNIGSFGEALTAYGTNVSTLHISAITDSVAAVEAVGKIAQHIPSDGGFIGLFTGRTDWAGITDHLVAFGGAVFKYGDAVNGMNYAAIGNSVSSVRYISQIADLIPKSGGFISLFTGNTDWVGINENLEEFGVAMKGYSFIVEAVDHDALIASIEDVKNIAAIADTMVNNKSFLSITDGILDAERLKTQLLGYASAMKEFSESIGSINFENLKQYANLEIVGADFVNAFANGMENKEFVVPNTLKGILEKTKVEASRKVATFRTVGEDLAMIIDQGLNSNPNVINVDIILQNAITNIRGYFGSFFDAAAYLGSAIGYGFSSVGSLINSYISSALNSAAYEVRNSYWEYYNDAYYVVKGLADGINHYTYVADNAIKNMVLSNRLTFRNMNGIHSPAEVYLKDAQYIPLGVAKGIDKESHVADESIESMGDGMIVALTPALEILAGLINGEFEFSPSIRPVVDMSDIYANAALIDQIFNDEQMKANDRAQSMSQDISTYERMRNSYSEDSTRTADKTSQAPVVNNYIYTQPGQSTEEIANEVERRMVRSFTQKKVAYANR